MKASLLVLALAFTGSQTIAFTDCRCGIVCEHQHGNKDVGCKDAPEKKGCCENESAPEPSCVHVEPASDLLFDAIGAEIPAPLALEAVERPEVFSRVSDLLGVSSLEVRPPPGRPLFLLNSSFLI
jgi:hypothetical protein